jgi:hypothetical protein
MDPRGRECEGLEWIHVDADGQAKITCKQRNELAVSVKDGRFLDTGVFARHSEVLRSVLNRRSDFVVFSAASNI